MNTEEKKVILNDIDQLLNKLENQPIIYESVKQSLELARLNIIQIQKMDF